MNLIFGSNDPWDMRKKTEQISDYDVIQIKRKYLKKIFKKNLMSQGSLDQTIRSLGQKVCSVARVQTDRLTDRHPGRYESEYRGHPFRVSGIFPSTYQQGSVQYTNASNTNKNVH